MKDLHNQIEATKFYEARYEEGYMEEWDDSKKYKVREILKGLKLPREGKALDFGCGNGVFTGILKECLPEWEIFGVEISKVAVANATNKYPSCKFFHVENAGNYKNQFDLVFSHHVIEHVPDLNETFLTIDSYLKLTSYQLHILPCGNKGSLEYNICQLKKNGIEKEKGNRFFFEEPGHLRRLTSDEFIEWAKKFGFQLENAFFANQYYGAINWITKSSPRFVKMLTSSENAINENAKKELNKLRRKLLPLTYLQFPYSKFWFIKSKWHKSSNDYIKLLFFAPPSLFSKPIYEKIEKASNEEWETRKNNKNGSEMFLFFKR